MASKLLVVRVGDQLFSQIDAATEQEREREEEPAIRRSAVVRRLLKLGLKHLHEGAK